MHETHNQTWDKVRAQVRAWGHEQNPSGGFLILAGRRLDTSQVVSMAVLLVLALVVILP